MNLKRLDPEIRSVLEASGLPWRLEYGKRHTKLYVGGHMIQTFPRDLQVNNWTAALNARANVRRRLAALTEEARQK